MSKYDILLWDVDQTLLDFDKSMDYALRYTFEQLHLEITDEIVKQYAAINDSYWKRLELGEVTKQELLIGRFATLLKELDLDKQITPEIIQPIYQKALGSVYFYLDDSIDLCRKLQGKVRQFVVSNGVAVTQTNKMQLSGLGSLMENVFISENIGIEKPSPQFFERCFSQIPDFKKEKTIIVGDSLSSDMKGGNAVNITCCWYNPEKKVRPSDIRIDYEITNLWEVEAIL